MSTLDILIVIFWFGLGISFIVAKGIWQARDYQQKLAEGNKLRVRQTSTSNRLSPDPALSLDGI